MRPFIPIILALVGTLAVFPRRGHLERHRGKATDGLPQVKSLWRRKRSTPGRAKARRRIGQFRTVPSERPALLREGSISVRLLCVMLFYRYLKFFLDMG